MRARRQSLLARQRYGDASYNEVPNSRGHARIVSEGCRAYIAEYFIAKPDLVICERSRFDVSNISIGEDSPAATITTGVDFYSYAKHLHLHETRF